MNSSRQENPNSGTILHTTNQRIAFTENDRWPWRFNSIKLWIFKGTMSGEGLTGFFRELLFSVLLQPLLSIRTRLCLKSGPLIDIGAVVQTLCLGALPYGLGTCIQNQGVQYSDMLRQVLNISENKRIVTSISIGYPDFSHPANQIKTGREPVEKLSSWYGF